MSAGERLVVGQIRGFHGLAGTVRVESLTDRPEDRFVVGRSLFVEGEERELTIVAADRDTVGWRMRFAEVTDRTAAEQLRDVYLEAIAEPGEELPRGEYYWHDVIGSSVTDVDGASLGEVVDIYRAGGAEVLLVRGPAGELDIPVVRSIVRIFAPKRGEIVVDRAALGLTEDAQAADAPEPDDDDEAAGHDGGVDPA